MASGGTGCQIKIQFLKPELLSVEDFENISDSELLDRTLVTQNIDPTSPLSSVYGEGFAYYYDQMQVETCATPEGLGMGDGDIVALWNLARLPKKKRYREKLKERILHLTPTFGPLGLNPVIGDDGGSKWPLELDSHGPTCTSKKEIDALFKRIGGSKSETELANQKLLENVEWDLGFSAAPELQANFVCLSECQWYQKMWVKDSRNENNNLSKFVEKVTFNLQVNIDGVPFPTTYTVTSWPYRFEGRGNSPPSKITVEVHFREPFASLLPGQDGVVKFDHTFDDNDIDGVGKVKWNRILEIGNNMNGTFKNVCEVILSLPVFRQSLLAGCNLDQVNMSADAMSKHMQSQNMEETLKYCAALNDLCTTDLLSKNVWTRQYITGEWSKWFLYIGPVRNGASCDQKSLMPIVWLAPYTAKGTVDNLVQIWKYYATKKGFQLPEGPFCVTYNGKKVDIGSNTNVLDIVDRSMSKHYFAIPLQGTDTRNINQLLEFIEGTETGAERKKKKKSGKKARVKETPEESADKGTGEVAGILEKTKIDSDGSSNPLMKSKKGKKTDKSGERLLSEPDRREKGSKASETEQSFNEGVVDFCHEGEQDQHASFLHGLDSNIQALKEELVRKEAKLGELWDSSQVLVESRGTEMSDLISAVEDVEEEKHSTLKQVTGLEDEMQNKRELLARMQERRDQLIKGVEEKNEILNESLKKKKQLEDLIEAEVEANKQSKRQLEKEIGSLQARIDALTKDAANISDTVDDKAKLETQKFLLNINKKIEDKESDLECPVCLEVSTSPIFSCDEQHIICSDCRPKVSICLQVIFSPLASVSGLNLSRV